MAEQDNAYRESQQPEKAAVTIDVNFILNLIQQLLPLLLQLFGKTSAAEQTHLMQQLQLMQAQTVTGDAPEGEKPSERASQKHPMTDEQWEQHQQQSTKKVPDRVTS